MGVIRRLVEARFGRSFLGVLLAVSAFAVAYALVGGTEFLMWLGLSRSVAGSITVGVVVLGVLAGMGAFARYAIDW